MNGSLISGAEEDKRTETYYTYLEQAEAQQVILAACRPQSQADIAMYEKKEDGSWNLLYTCDAYIGREGYGKTKEGDALTPLGVYDLSGAFGILENPGTDLPYVDVTPELYVCGDPEYYNQLININEKPHNCTGEHLIDYVPHYNYGMFIDYNKECIYGEGSAIFFHCSGSKPYTEGCIAVSEPDMIGILKLAHTGIRIHIFEDPEFAKTQE